MKLLLTVVALLLMVVVVVYAAADEEGPIGVNQLRTSPMVKRYLQDDQAVPTFVEGRLATKVARGTEIAATYRFFEENKSAWRMTDPQAELTVARMDVDDIGMRHVRLTQQYLGIPVIGGELIAHFSADDVLKTVNGHFRADIDIDVTPQLTTSDATRIADEDLQSFFGKGSPETPTLVIFPWEGTDYLAWRLWIYSDTPMGRWEYFVNAKTGEVIFKANRIMNVDAIGTGIGVMGDPRNHIDTDYNGSTYRMIDHTRQAGNNPHGHDGQMPAGGYIQTNLATTSLPGTLATDADNYWDDVNLQRPAVDGQVYTALVYDYMLHHLGRNGYNDAGASMLTVVNYSAEGDNNAYWDGSRIVVWSWSTGWRSLAGCPDVIAHEWGHAITENCSGLVYQKEPGALNESFSDMMGAAFEFAHDTLDVPDWDMGENGRTTGVGFRSMSNPHEFGDPDTYGTGDPYWVDVVNCSPSYYNDYCGVHTNSGVGNKWFFLLSDGGTHNGQAVTGIGVQNAILVAYRANQYYWTSQSTYIDAALGTMTAADDLDPSGNWATHASEAWNAVNVQTPLPGITISYPNGVPSTISPDSATPVTVMIAGQFGAEVDAGSGRLHYSVDGGTYVHQTLTLVGTDLYEGTLPSVPCGSSIDFYFSARMVGGTSLNDPDPSTPFTAIPATAVAVLFDDDFETNTGWTTSGSATAGLWDRGTPVGLGDRGDPPTDYDGSGQCYLTENVYGNSDIDGGTAILTSPTIDLSSGDATVSFARWFSNNWGSAPNEDVDLFIIRVSNDNGSSWVIVDTVGPVDGASGGWIEDEFRVGQFVTPTATMKVQFQAQDLGNGSVVEAGLDAFAVKRIECQAASGPQIQTTSLPDWTVGIAYSQQLNATGGTGALTWDDMNGDLTGTGLSLSGGGLLSGTPSSSGSIAFTARVTDETPASDQQPLSFTVNPAVSITTSTIPNATLGVAYSQQLAATGGTGSLTWTDVNGDLAGTGLSLSSSGLLSGTASSTGPISFTAQAVDPLGSTDQQALSFTVVGVITIDPTELPDWTVGMSYSQQLTAAGGTGALTWEDVNGDLSGTGLTLSSSGLLSGTPASTGAISFTARVTDETMATDTYGFSFDVNDPVAINAATLPDWTVGVAFSQQLTATGGTGSKTWQDLNADLTGTGLTLSSGGLLSGTPTSTGAISFTARAIDQVGSSDDQAFGFTINGAVAVDPATLPAWTAGVAYSQQLTASGGTGAMTFEDANGDLVGTGLSISAGGELAGVPTTTGVIAFTARATDAVGGQGEEPMSVTINPAVSMITTGLPDGKQGDAYSQQLEATGGTGALTWTDLNDELGAFGLTLSTDGLLSGTPSDSGMHSFTAQVVDAVGSSAGMTLSMYFEPAFVCGDIDGDGSDPNVGDLTYLVDFLFNGGPPPPIEAAADVDGSGDLNVSDLTYLVEFLFDGGPAPNCP